MPPSPWVQGTEYRGRVAPHDHEMVAPFCLEEYHPWAPDGEPYQIFKGAFSILRYAPGSRLRLPRWAGLVASPPWPRTLPQCASVRHAGRPARPPQGLSCPARCLTSPHLPACPAQPLPARPVCAPLQL